MESFSSQIAEEHSLVLLGFYAKQEALVLTFMPFEGINLRMIFEPPLLLPYKHP
jgi:hypothetical protein